jgi:hypothetical protein
MMNPSNFLVPVSKVEVKVDILRKAVDAGVPNLADSFVGGTLGLTLWIQSIINIVFSLATLGVFLLLVWGAIDWIMSGGEKSKIESARNKMTNAVIGLVILMSSLALFMLVQNLLGICVVTIIGTNGGVCE